MEIDSLWNFGKPAETEQRFRALLETARGTESDAYVAELLTQIARTLGLQQKFDDAKVLLDEADAMITSDMTRARVRSLLERGRMLNSSNRQQEALPVFRESFDVAVANGHENFAVDAAHMLGIVEKGEDSIGWNEMAISIAEKATEAQAKLWLGSLYNNLGWTYFALQRYQDALDMFQRNEAFRRAQNNEYEVGVALWCIAKAKRFLGDVEESLRMQLDLLTRPANKDNSDEGFCQEEIGECLFLLGRAEESKPYFARAWELLQQDIWIKRDEPERLARLKSLGGLD